MQNQADNAPSRRAFLDQLRVLTFALAVPAVPALAGEPEALIAPRDASTYDLRWIDQLRDATDRGLIDSTLPSRVPLMIAARYLDNCDAAYGVGKHRARVVVNLRTRASALGVSDALWRRFEIGAETGISDPLTNAPALRNPFVDRPPGIVPEEGALSELVARGAILLVCDFALGHLARSIANKRGGLVDDVHRELTSGLVPGAFAVPSGIFGAIRAQNAGCGYVGGV